MTNFYALFVHVSSSVELKFNYFCNDSLYKQSREKKLFSIGDQFKIKDDREHDMFIVKSKVLSIGDRLVLEDINGK
mgnify:CR=1 FL=1